MENYLELFISELQQYIRQLNKQLLILEAQEDDLAAIAEIFRIFHTIKGMAQTMGYTALGDVSHRIEDLLGVAKEAGHLEARVIDFLFHVVDILTQFTRALQENKALPSVDEIHEGITQLLQGEDWQHTGARAGSEEIADIRIKMEKLDKLFNLANELIINKARISKLSDEIGDSRLALLSDRTARLISSLQDEVMRLRMLPLSTVFDFFPRWFRDVTKSRQKEVILEIAGAEIEVDRSIIDVLKEPLMHLIRNAVDHGIADQHGSATKARVTLKAEREKERIMISVIDNGKGIDIDTIKQKALERGLISEADAARMQDEAVFRLLTNPDFSTRDEVTDISGRGVGLDIVDRTATKLGGRLLITSELGQGSCFTLELPLSLAIVRAMTFRLDGQRLAIPLSYIQETFYADSTKFSSVYHHDLYPLRDEILPLVRLARILSCHSNDGRKSVIVIEHQGKRKGFVTDGILGTEEIVVKKLDSLINVPYYSGCSIFTDGLPILILDPRGFA